MWIPTGVRGFPTLSPLCLPPMLYLYVSYQQPERQLFLSLSALNPTPLPLLVGRPRFHQTSPVRRLQLRSHGLAQAADHYDCLTDVSI